MKKQAIEITTAAQTQIVNILQDQEDKVLVLALNNKGCSGHSYTFDLADTTIIKKFDEVIQLNEHKIVVPASSVLNLLGSTLDYHQDQFGGKFVWHNPNVANTCGCGSSVGFEKC
jgi:iron-sulfur cluster assembly protein